MTDFIPDHANARQLRDALGAFATGVTVVTIATDEGPQAMTANSFASVSLVPPLVLWSPGKFSRRHDMFARAPYFSIHILSEDQLDLARHFATAGTTFDGIPHRLTPEGVPLLEVPLARFDCEQAASYDAGDHTIVLGQVLRANLRPGRPLLFSQGQFARLP